MRRNYANVVSTLALVFALVGGAYAAGLGRDTVGPKQIRSAAVRGDELKDDAAKGADIDEATLGQVPDAATVGGQAPSSFLPSGGKAADADLLDNQDSSAFLGVNDTAADSDQLGGINAIDYVRGGEITAFAAQPLPGQTVTVAQSSSEQVQFHCPAGNPSLNPGTVTVVGTPQPSVPSNYFVTNGNTTEHFAGLAQASVPVAADGGWAMASFSDQFVVVETTVFAVNGPQNCQVQAHDRFFRH